jgi:hypothetical protein
MVSPSLAVLVRRSKMPTTTTTRTNRFRELFILQKRRIMEDAQNKNITVPDMMRQVERLVMTQHGNLLEETHKGKGAGASLLYFTHLASDDNNCKLYYVTRGSPQWNSFFDTVPHWSDILEKSDDDNNFIVLFSVPRDAENIVWARVFVLGSRDIEGNYTAVSLETQ